MISPAGWGILLALLSAVAGAVGHASIKNADDRFATRVLISVMSVPIALPILIAHPAPAGLWPWIILSAALHCGYNLMVLRSYAHGNLASSFPLARGVAPLSTALLAWALFGEQLGLLPLLGASFISAGIAALASGKRMRGRSAAAAIAAGLLTTAYNLADAQGVKRAADPLAFAGAYFVTETVGMVLIAMLWRRSWQAPVRRDLALGTAAGIVTTAGYLSALLAYSLQSTAVVAGLRETSVLFAVLLARYWLREEVGRRTIAAAAVIVLGAVLLAGG